MERQTGVNGSLGFSKGLNVDFLFLCAQLCAKRQTRASELGLYCSILRIHLLSDNF